MKPHDSRNATTAEEADEPRTGRRRAARYVVPVAVVGVAAATIGLVPALADSGGPDLPEITAAELIEKIAASDVEQLSGTVKITTDLGLPDLGGLESSFASGAMGRDGTDGSSADPSARLTELASGTHTLRIAADGPDRQKVSVIEDAAEYSLIHNGEEVWGYDSASNEVYHATVGESGDEREQQPPATPKDFVEQVLKSVDDTTSVTVDGTAQVAGRDAYRLVVEPRQSDSTVGVISIAVDHRTGMPLKFTLTPASGGAAVVDVGFTQVSFDRPAASTFAFTPPKGAEVTEKGEVGPGRAHPAGPVVGLGKGAEAADKGEVEPGRAHPAEPWRGAEPAAGLDKGAEAADKGEVEPGRAHPAEPWRGAEPAAGLDKGAEAADKGEVEPGRAHPAEPWRGAEPAAGLGKSREGLTVLGEGWNSIAVLDTGLGGGLPTGGGDLGGFLGSLGEQVEGDFGTGTVFSTRLINALVTDDGTVYVGAVTKDALVKAAGEGK